MVNKSDVLTMDDVHSFIKNGIQLEYEALVAQYTEEDSETFETKVQLYEKCLANGVRSDLQRPSTPDQSWFSRGRKRIHTGALVPRTVFQIKLYHHPAFNRLYRAYLSLTMPLVQDKSMYFLNYFISQAETGFNIISRYNIDLLPDQPGSRFRDRDLSWIWHSGEKFFSLGNFVMSKKFRSPDRLDHLEEYKYE